MLDSILSAEHICYSINNHELIHDISLNIPRGSFVGLIGHNGSGKSTLLKTIYRVNKASKGTVYINGTDMDKLSNREIAKQMAVVTQENDINFDFTVMEIMMIGRYAHQNAFSSRETNDREICHKALAMVGMQCFETRSFLSLSGGEKQRVLIASAFSRETELVVLDEPTNHLDIGHQLLIMDIMKQQKGITVFSSIHDMNIAMEYCDYVIALNKGEVAAFGKPEDILTKELLRDLFRVRAEICERADGKPYIQYLGTLVGQEECCCSK